MIEISESKIRSVVMSALRRASRFWEPAVQCIKNAKVAPGQYRCNHCKLTFKQKEIKADHISPIIPVTGFDGWDNVIKRLFCNIDGYQALCKSCHDIKTKEENLQRKSFKKKKAVIKYRNKREIDV